MSLKGEIAWALIVSALIVVLLSTNSFASETSENRYVCVAEQVTGFYYNKDLKQWSSSNFKSKEKYIISNSTINGFAYEVKVMGDNLYFSRCKDDFNDIGFLFCTGLRDFRFNNKNGRFMTYSYLGYITVLPSINNITDETSDTPFLAIGTCSPFNGNKQGTISK